MKILKAILAWIWSIVTLSRWRRWESELLASIVATAPFNALIREWTAYLWSESDPVDFAHSFLEILRNKDRQEQSVYSFFAAWINPRDWRTVRRALSEHVEPETRSAFKLPEAEAFYETFRATVVESIRDYWQTYARERKKTQ